MPLTAKQFAAKHGHTWGQVRMWIARGQLPVISRRPTLIPDDARPRLGGATIVRAHKFGGLLCVAAGPGRIRRSPLSERHQDARERGALCGCDLCVEIAAQERLDASKRVYDSLRQDLDSDED